jgi:hypothetical protein
MNYIVSSEATYSFLRLPAAHFITSSADRITEKSQESHHCRTISDEFRSDNHFARINRKHSSLTRFAAILPQPCCMLDNYRRSGRSQAHNVRNNVAELAIVSDASSFGRNGEWIPSRRGMDLREAETDDRYWLWRVFVDLTSLHLQLPSWLRRGRDGGGQTTKPSPTRPHD